MKALPLLIAFMVGYPRVQAQTATIVLQIEGIDSRKGGNISAALFTEINFLKEGKQAKAIEAIVVDSTMQLILTDVPPGTYGVAAFQDVDRNKVLKKNFIGLPVEPMGFSNNPRIRFGPPSFDNVKFSLSRDRVVLRIILH